MKKYKCVTYVTFEVLEKVLNLSNTLKIEQVWQSDNDKMMDRFTVKIRKKDDMELETPILPIIEEGNYCPYYSLMDLQDVEKDTNVFRGNYFCNDCDNGLCERNNKEDEKCQ